MNCVCGKELKPFVSSGRMPKACSPECRYKATYKPHPRPPPGAPTLDHIKPLSRGGTHEEKNVQCACFSCNTKKGNNMHIGTQLRLIE